MIDVNQPTEQLLASLSDQQTRHGYATLLRELHKCIGEGYSDNQKELLAHAAKAFIGECSRRAMITDRISFVEVP